MRLRLPPSKLCWRAVGLIFLCAAQDSLADTLEKLLLMPGPVIEAHADIESDCQQCHSPLSDEPQLDLCVACHEEVGADIRTRQGYHGLVTAAREAECETCHTEHEGRDFVAVNLDLESFDHALTDFPLFGAHASAECESCHAPGDPFRVAETTCFACHHQDDVHDGRLGVMCADCHSASNWLEVRFDHEQTQFPLTGQHAVLDCQACHAEQTFRFASVDCVSCHRADDVHKGGNGEQCESCHDSTSWSRISFDHFGVSGFRLTGGHGGLTCQACHEDSDHRDLQGVGCYDCHKTDDTHQGRMGPACGACHNVRSWATVAFDHGKESGFWLNGAHGALACEACHVTSVSNALPRDCGGCHGDDDPHNAQLGNNCSSCHGETSWTANLRFDHDLVAFPLVGGHQDLECKQCHATAAFHDAPSDCQACHAEDDVHGGALGSQCELCHNPASWAVWRFDHTHQTRFPLTGTHIDLACAACHDQPATGGVLTASANCGSCHRRDDPHAGRFGTDCSRCHTTTSFTEIEGF